MSFPGRSNPLMTLEPLLEAVREGLEGSGWELSGLQKTTSYEFEGRWAGDSSRSAYLFFHKSGVPEGVSLDVFLDETSQGLKGNLALVMDGPSLGELAPPGEVLEGLAEVARGHLPQRYRTPITLRLSLPALGSPAAEVETEYRIKLYIPREALRAGHSAVSALAATASEAFGRVLESPDLVRFLGESAGP